MPASMSLHHSPKSRKNSFTASSTRMCWVFCSLHRKPAKLFGENGGSIIKYWLDRQPRHAAHLGSLYGHKRRGGCDHTGSPEGTRTDENSRQFDQSRHGGDRGC